MLSLADKRKWRRGVLLLIVPPFLYWLGFQSWEIEPSSKVLARWQADRLAERAALTNYPAAHAVTLSCRSKKNTYVFGEAPQLVFLFSNASPETVYFSRSEAGDFVLQLNFWMEMVRDDGKDESHGSDVCEEREKLRLEPGQTKTIEYPPRVTSDGNRWVDENTPLPGHYSFHVEMWLNWQGQPKHLVSAAQHFQIVDDGSGDVQKAVAARTGRGVREHLELIVRDKASNGIWLFARNHGKETLYLGAGWSWWHKRCWRFPHPDMGGVRQGGIIEVPPGETVDLGGMGIRADEVGLHAVEARYRAAETGRLKTSNRIYVWVNGVAPAVHENKPSKWKDEGMLFSRLGDRKG